MLLKTKYKKMVSSICIISLVAVFFLDAKERRERKQDVRLRKNRFEIKTETKKIEKPVYELTYEELSKRKDELLAFGNTEAAVKIIEQMLRLSSNIDMSASLILELADVLYNASKFETALNTYKNFITFYEGHAQFEYALFRAIQCSSRLVLNFDRDQKITEDTLALVEQYLSSEHCTVHRGEVEHIKDDCIRRLFASELYTIEFYAKIGKIPVAQNHLEHLKTQESFKILHGYQEEIDRLNELCLVKEDEKLEENDLIVQADVEEVKTEPEHSLMSIYNEIF